jgi:hypoxanthine phosphoribosyltransferase
MARIREVYSTASIEERVQALAAEISHAYEGKEVTVLGVMDDSFVFLADLLRLLKIPVRTSFLRYDHVSRGGIQDLSFMTRTEISGLNILVSEAVLDTGVPQEYLLKQLESRGAASCKLCVLLDKPEGRRVDIVPDFRGFETKEPYIFGYGLGFQDRWRELPYLASFVEE